MKKIVAVLLTLLLLATTLAVFAACRTDDAETLVVYNWVDYIYNQEELENDFAEYYLQKTGKKVKITYVTFDTNETMLTKVMRGDSAIDVMCPSEYAIQKLIEGGYLQKINYFTDSDFENADKVDEAIVTKIRESFSTAGFDMSEYFVPYMWGTLGVLYNADVISPEDAEAAGWGLLWNKNSSGKVSDAISKKIYMKDSIRDSYCAVLMYMKEYGLLPAEYADLSVERLINTVDDKLLAAAEEVLKAQKSELYGYEVDFGKNELIAGTALVDLAWSGDAFYAIEEAEAEGVNLEYFIPEIGSNVWFDGWVIPKTAKNAEAAKYFIDFLNDPEIAMKNMMEIGYTSAVDKDVFLANENAMVYFAEIYADDPSDEEEVDELIELYFDDDSRYPDTMREDLGMMHDFGESNEKVVAMWERVRAEGISTAALLLIVFAAVLIVALVIIFVMKKRAGTQRRVVKK